MVFAPLNALVSSARFKVTTQIAADHESACGDAFASLADAITCAGELLDAHKGRPQWCSVPLIVRILYASPCWEHYRVEIYRLDSRLPAGMACYAAVIDSALGETLQLQCYPASQPLPEVRRDVAESLGKGSADGRPVVVTLFDALGRRIEASPPDGKKTS